MRARTLGRIRAPLPWRTHSTQSESTPREQIHAGWATAATLVNANIAFSGTGLRAGVALLVAAYASVRRGIIFWFETVQG